MGYTLNNMPPSYKCGGPLPKHGFGDFIQGTGDFVGNVGLGMADNLLSVAGAKDVINADSYSGGTADFFGNMTDITGNLASTGGKVAAGLLGGPGGAAAMGALQGGVGGMVNNNNAEQGQSNLPALTQQQRPPQAIAPYNPYQNQQFGTQQFQGNDLKGYNQNGLTPGMFANGGPLQKSYNNANALTDSNFQNWYKNNTLEGKKGVPYDSTQSYDYYSFYKNNGKGSIENHFPDTFKRPSHPTFSNESIYSTPENPGGSWEGENYSRPEQGLAKGANGGRLPSYNHGGPHDPPQGQGDPAGYKYSLARRTMSNTPEGMAMSDISTVPLDIDANEFARLGGLQQQYLDAKKLVGYTGEDIAPNIVKERSPNYYTARNAYFESLKPYGLGNIDTSGNTERVTEGATAGSEDWYGKFNENQNPALSATPFWEQSNAGPSNLQTGKVYLGRRYNARTGKTEPYYGEQSGVERGLNVIEGNTRKLDERYDTQGRGVGAEYYKKADGGMTHPQAEYEVEKDEIMYHPNDKPVSLANGGLNQVAEDFSKVTGNKHSAPEGGPQMKGGEGGYVYSDQLKVPKDLYNTLKGLI
jgi:hypothetical protein